MLTRKNIVLILLTLSLFAVSCRKQSKRDIRKLSPKDTIYSPISNNIECSSKVAGYYEKYGIVISNFYKFSDVKAFDYDFDGSQDSLVILRPFYFNNNDLENDCGMSKKDKVLLILKMEKGNITKTFKFYNILSNNSSLLGSEEIKIHQNKFSINGDWGHSNKFYSDIYISFKKDYFYIDSIHIESEGLHQYNKLYPLKINLNRFNTKILDSLRILNEK